MIDNTTSTERAYRWVKDIVDRLPTTTQRELQWAQIRPEPPRHMNLALNPRPSHFGRACRFRVGDHVNVCHQTPERIVTAVECPEVNPIGWSHCMGNDAIYTLDNGARHGDLELSFSRLNEHFFQLPSGRWVRLTLHLQRMVALVDKDYKPLGAEDLSMEDWEYIFFSFLRKPDILPAHA